MFKRMTLRFALALAMLFALVVTFGCAFAPQDEGEGNAPQENTQGEAVVQEELDSTDACPSKTGKLKVKGAQLCSEGGKPVQLRGVSTHGLAWYPEYVNQQFFDELREDWGANVVRLAMYTAESGGYCTDGNPEELEQLVRDGVSYAEAADLYAVVDWHILSDSNPNAHISEASGFFSRMSAEFADRSNVIYEICNEPNGSTTWDQIKDYAEQIIPVIRENDPDAVVVVGTPTWSQRVDEAALSPLDFPNVMYALHFYAATHQADLRDKMASAVAAGLPVFVTEFGICDAIGNGQVDYQSADAWVSLMDDLGVSFICWNLSNKDESSALFLASCMKTSGFDESDLSAEGRWLVGVLGSSGFDGIARVPEGSETTTGGTNESYTSSGQTITGSSGAIEWEAAAVNSWESGGATCTQFSVTIKNAGANAPGWEIAIPFGSFTLQDGWNGSFSKDGNNLLIANAPYNGSIPSGGQVSDIGFIVAQ